MANKIPQLYGFRQSPRLNYPKSGDSGYNDMIVGRKHFNNGRIQNLIFSHVDYVSNSGHENRQLMSNRRLDNDFSNSLMKQKDELEKLQEQYLRKRSQKIVQFDKRWEKQLINYHKHIHYQPMYNPNYSPAAEYKSNGDNSRIQSRINEKSFDETDRLNKLKQQNPSHLGIY